MQVLNGFNCVDQSAELVIDHKLCGEDDRRNRVSRGSMTRDSCLPCSILTAVTPGSGTGLTHLGYADTRVTMHAKLEAGNQQLPGFMKMFRAGLEGGEPQAGERCEQLSAIDHFLSIQAP